MKYTWAAMHAYNQSSVILFYNDIIFFSITLTYISFTNKLRILLWSVHTSIINTSTDSKPFCVPLWVWKFPMISYGHSMYKRPTRVIKKKSIRCIIPPLSIFFFRNRFCTFCMCPSYNSTPYECSIWRLQILKLKHYFDTQLNGFSTLNCEYTIS